jgi:hypothetical protein
MQTSHNVWEFRGELQKERSEDETTLNGKELNAISMASQL